VLRRPPPLPQGNQSGRPLSPAQSTPAPLSHEAKVSFEVRLGQKWALIAGIVTMVFGVAYFLKYSFDQGWIGPAGRVGLAYLWGAGFLVGGNSFRQKGYSLFGLNLIGGGIAVLYFATFAAFQLYHLFPQVPAFALMVLTTGLAGTLAIRYNTKWLAVLGLVGGFSTPILLSSGENHEIVLFSYMLILNLGILGIALYQKWDLLNFLGFAFTYVIYTAWYFGAYNQEQFWPAIIFLNLFYLIYSLVPFAYQFLRNDMEKLRGFLIMAPNAFIAFGYSFSLIKHRFSLPWVSIVTLFYTLVFLSLASFLAKRGKQHLEAFMVLLAKSAMFLIITVPILFSGQWITIFWATQTVVLLWMALKLKRSSMHIGSYILLLLTLGKFLCYDYPAIFHLSTFPCHFYQGYGIMLFERWLVTGFVLGMLVAVRRLLGTSGCPGLLPDNRDRASITTLGIFMLFGILHIETSAFFATYLAAARSAAVSVLWTLFSISLMILGFRLHQRRLRQASLGIFCLTLIKVFFSDMSDFSTPYRIISCIILGIVLVATSYLYHRFKDGLIQAISGDNTKEPTP
jgi:uncharacterized membrane protein